MRLVGFVKPCINIDKVVLAAHPLDPHYYAISIYMNEVDENVIEHANVPLVPSIEQLVGPPEGTVT